MAKISARALSRSRIGQPGLCIAKYTGSQSECKPDPAETAAARTDMVNAVPAAARLSSGSRRPQPAPADTGRAAAASPSDTANPLQRERGEFLQRGARDRDQRGVARGKVRDHAPKTVGPERAGAVPHAFSIRNHMVS